jgi:hypothetical protein
MTTYTPDPQQLAEASRLIAQYGGYFNLPWLQRTFRLTHPEAIATAEALEAGGSITPQWRADEKREALRLYRQAARNLSAVRAGRYVPELSGEDDARGVAESWYQAAQRLGATEAELSAAASN